MGKSRFGYIVCESTYGGRSRDKSELNFENRISKLEDVIVETLHKKQGNLIIPAFSMHRTQEILFDLYYLFKVRWKELLKNGTCKIPLIDFLKHRGYLQGSQTISENRLLQLRNFSEISADIFDIILASYRPYYVSSEEVYTQLTEKFIDFDSTEVHVESDQGKYRIYINDNTALESSIDQFRQENSNIIKKRYVFDESTFLSLFKGNTEVLIEINESPVHVRLDSPLGAQITEIYSEELTSSYMNEGEVSKLYLNKNIPTWLGLHPDDVDSEIRKLFGYCNFKVGPHSIERLDPKLNKPKKKAKINYSDRPTIYVSASGMCDAGEVQRHLNANLGAARNSVLMTGYQSPGSNGGLLTSYMENPDKVIDKALKFTIDNKQVVFKCEHIKAQIYSTTGYSGHSDHEGLLSYLFDRAAKEGERTIPNIILNHGNDDSRLHLKESILQRHADLFSNEGVDHPISVICPDRENGWYDLDENKWLDKETMLAPDTGPCTNLESKITALTKAIEDLTIAITNMKS